MSNQAVSAHNSLSSSSVITVQRGPGQNADAIRIRSASPAEGALLAARALKATSDGKGRQSNDERDRHPQRSGTSPTTSPPSARHPSESEHSSRFRQPTAGNRLGEYLPGKIESGNSSRKVKPTFGVGGLARLNTSSADPTRRHIRPPSSPNTMRSLTPGALTPASAGESNDYFGLGIAVSRDGSKTPRTADTEPRSPALRRARDSQPDSPGSQRRPSRTGGSRKDRDKKTMLSKALEKANTAVLLDNAQNFEGALDAYTDACKLLEQVMERTSAADDRAKLDAIRNTYAARIEELVALKQQSSAAPTTEKQLPPRPSSDNYALHLPPNSSATFTQSSEVPAAPAASTAERTRDSFLTDVIREVEGSRASGFLGPLWERSKGPLLTDEGSSRSRDDLTSADAPQPLTPRSRSPNVPAKDHVEVQKGGEVEAGSWLNTIDESDDDAASLHSVKNEEGIRRRNISRGETRKVSDFDTAFDEAVEAAYEQGYEPDQRDDEQQMMDDIARDYMDQGFAFSEKSKSSLPRESGSTAGTRDTWKSSVAGPDRTTTGTSLSTLDEDHGGVLPRNHQPQSSTSTSQTSDETVAMQTKSVSATPIAEVTGERRSRFSTGSIKPLSIDTMHKKDRKRAPSTASRQTQSSQRDIDVVPWEAVDNKAEVTPWEVQPMQKAEVTPWEVQPGPGGIRPTQMGSLRRLDRDGSGPASAVSDTGSFASSDIASPKARNIRSKRSSMSLRDTMYSTSAPSQTDVATPTPLSSTFSSGYLKRNESTGHHSQRSMTVTSTGATSMPPLPDQTQQGGYYLFDTTLGRSMDGPASATSPKVFRESLQPAPFEPCPDSPLLRPFWLMRLVANSVIHPRGAYITTRLFMPREAWMNRSIKLRNVEDKIAACDLLSAALSPLRDADMYDADSVLIELQKLEEVMERVQQMLVKKLGSEVGVSNVTSSFKEADKSNVDGPPDAASRDTKNKFSWRKLRGKSAMPGANGVVGSVKGAPTGESVTMQTVPMTSFNGVEKRASHRFDALGHAVFEGPHKDYMAALARVCESAQAIDQIARQVEDPGLKASSTTLVGLELSTRHAAEFFGFYLCRFMLGDVGTLIDKHVKRSTEWVLS